MRWLVLVVLSGCVPIYSTKCATADDCVDVFLGEACVCSCGRDAIAKSELARFTADRDAVRARECPHFDPSACGPCLERFIDCKPTGLPGDLSCFSR